MYNPASPHMGTKPNCKKMQSEHSELWTCVWIDCQHRNDPSFHNSLLNEAS